MKVAIIQKDLKNLRSGVSRLVRSELEALDRAGIQSIVVSEKVNPVVHASTMARVKKTIRWPLKGFFRRAFFKFQAGLWIKNLKPDVSVGHGDIADVDICFIHNCVHLEHEVIQGKALPERNDVGKLYTQVLSASQFKTIVCNSEMMKQDLTNRFALQGKNIEVLYPGCDPDHVLSCDTNVRDNLNIEEEAFVIGLITSGNFKKRNVDFFLEFTKSLQFDHPLHIVVAGNGKRSAYTELINSHPHAVHFLPSTDCVANYYSMLDVFVLPAHIEEFGMSALEAMTCSKPVVLHKMVGASEILEGESLRFSLPSLNKDVWVSSVQDLLDDQALRNRVARQNQETSLKYTAKEQNKKFIALVQAAYQES
ncbi:hypothetical protein A3715_13180 [Oleiphilus sp. HI0009]|uniref:glycosyltransferase family 4 protein n=1 Tax=unclassified Oleiphilus TaxID=2631174 RepID=UPI0007C25102|nr:MULTISPECIES: glycosyltransferase family 4 protein [unclassified Oleiphilus]KZX76450.1 hypothetical protein A3715_13180 [Oleiphilus sp. HI0009]MCH2158982.1 glycosyltransferase family 4 protein [Oleiphilaceae bacterium]KZY63522.1 hypothetical protein A3738_11720 [Oleiphilus sp. HI0066]KZY70534.1 hypothetical protein A3739_17840 [Oleiphilus sp. HI0067]KZY74008.1 hypothetical protein A3739_14940 [Oleiphilus sp. HI0067]